MTDSLLRSGCAFIAADVYAVSFELGPTMSFRWVLYWRWSSAGFIGVGGVRRV
jgi:hypothetical protein